MCLIFPTPGSAPDQLYNVIHAYIIIIYVHIAYYSLVPRLPQYFNVILCKCVTLKNWRHTIYIYLSTILFVGRKQIFGAVGKGTETVCIYALFLHIPQSVIPE